MFTKKYIGPIFIYNPTLLSPRTCTFLAWLNCVLNFVLSEQTLRGMNASPSIKAWEQGVKEREEKRSQSKMTLTARRQHQLANRVEKTS